MTSLGRQDLDAPRGRILPDRIGLVLGRVFLVVGRHPDVFGGPHGGCGPKGIVPIVLVLPSLQASPFPFQPLQQFRASTNCSPKRTSAYRSARTTL